MRANRVSRVRSGAPSRPRRNAAAARYLRPGASRRSLEVRHRRRKAARDAQLRTARDAGACEALPSDGPPCRRPRRPRAGARRLLAIARNARDRRGDAAVSEVGVGLLLGRILPFPDALLEERIRPIEASKAAIGDVRLTSIPAGRNAQIALKNSA